MSVAFTVVSDREFESFGKLKCSLPGGGLLKDLRIFTGAQISFGRIRKIALSFTPTTYDEQVLGVKLRGKLLLVGSEGLEPPTSSLQGRRK